MMSVKDKLERDLKKYKIVLLISSSFPQCKEVLCAFKENEDFHIYCPFEMAVDCSNAENISAVMEKEMLDFYYMYEFSDRFWVVDNGQQYGSLLNYIKTGIMTFDEVVESIKML
ncbi:hypothetical protein [Butyrivibrio sp.]|uniref:hypothetical protein n=1 Tax=Butyrivibrio sp. TaxID=28121 RepID=UPI0025B97973|nr:hypothetical protein [Butyrivibrio sp.]MBE5837062.1 hypothetical protein [Butyrivibrio sp.]